MSGKASILPGDCPTRGEDLLRQLEEVHANPQDPKLEADYLKAKDHLLSRVRRHLGDPAD